MNRTSAHAFVTTMLISIIAAPILYGVSRDVVLAHRRVYAAHSSAIEVHYAPSEDLEALDITTLSHAHYSIDMVAYSLTDTQIIETLIREADAGVLVNVYLDKEQTTAEMRRPQLAQLLLQLSTTRNANVRVKGRAMLQHMKAYAIDAQLLRTGSANFSRQAEQNQDNDLLLTNDGPAIAAFEINFRALTSRSDNEPLSESR